MRKEFEPYENLELKFEATYIATDKQKHHLLFDIISKETGYTDHVWIKKSKELEKMNLKENDRITFKATIRKYIKHKEMNTKLELDYELVNLKEIQKI